MRLKIVPGFLTLFGLLYVLLASAGCTPADRWPPFTDQQLSPPQPEDVLTPLEPVRFSEKDSSPQIPETWDFSQLSVEQAVMMALHHNSDLQVQQYTPLITGTFEQIERGSYDPELFAQLEYFQEESAETSRSSGEEFSVEADEVTAVAGLRQTLPTGTTLETSVSHERTISNRAPEQQAARVDLTITQSLLRGLGPAVNMAAIRQAELDTMASVEELRGFTETLLADAEIAYWHYVLAEEEIAIFQSSLDIARQQRQEVESRIEVGILPEIEVAAAKAEEALRIQALLDARSTMEERRLRLLRLIAPDTDTFDNPEGAKIRTVSSPRISPRPISDLDEHLQLADRYRSDLNAARLQLRRNSLTTIVTRNGLLPRLDFFIALGKTGYADTFSDAYRDLDGSTYDLTTGLHLSHMLGNRTAKARDLAALASRQQARAAVENLRQIVNLDVRLAANEVERTRQQIDASRTTRIFQEQTLVAEEERFDVGTSTALLVAQAQRDLLQARIAEIEAIVNYRIARVNLYLAEGSLLERRGIEITGTNN